MEDQLDMTGILDKITAKDPRYKADAYLFVLDALNVTVSKLERPRHVSGQELSEGIRLFAIDRFGPMARTVLESWGITRTDDFGNIVFNLIDAKLLSKTDDDSIGDFKEVYDFRDAFARPIKYKIE